MVEERKDYAFPEVTGDSDFLARQEETHAKLLRAAKTFYGRMSKLYGTTM